MSLEILTGLLKSLGAGWDAVAAEELERHLDGCAACRREMATLERVPDPPPAPIECPSMRVLERLSLDAFEDLSQDDRETWRHVSLCPLCFAELETVHRTLASDPAPGPDSEPVLDLDHVWQLWAGPGAGYAPKPPSGAVQAVEQFLEGVRLSPPAFSFRGAVESQVAYQTGLVGDAEVDLEYPRVRGKEGDPPRFEITAGFPGLPDDQGWRIELRLKDEGLLLASVAWRGDRVSLGVVSPKKYVLSLRKGQKVRGEMPVDLSQVVAAYAAMSESC